MIAVQNGKSTSSSAQRAQRRGSRARNAAVKRQHGDCGVVAGESGAAGLAGLIAVCADDSGAALGLGPDSTVLVVNTEGATDPVNYRAQVGRDPEAVAAASATIRRDAGVVDL